MCFRWLAFYLPCIGGWPPGGGYWGSERGKQLHEIKKKYLHFSTLSIIKLQIKN